MERSCAWPQVPGWLWLGVLALLSLGLGCTSTVTRQEFEVNLWRHKGEDFSAVWYMGSDAVFHYLRHQHNMGAGYYRIPRDELAVADEHPYTRDRTQWRLLMGFSPTGVWQPWFYVNDPWSLTPSLNSGDKDKDEPTLHRAVWNNDTAKMGALLAAGANANARDKFGWTALDWALMMMQGQHGVTLAEPYSVEGEQKDRVAAAVALLKFYGAKTRVQLDAERKETEAPKPSSP